MTSTGPQARPAPATPLTFAANPGGRFPSVLTEDDGRVTAPAGGEPMWVIHRYEDLLSVKSSPAWRMANRCETPLTGAEIPGGDPPGHMLGMDGATHRKLRRTIGHLFTSGAADALRPQMRETAAGLLDQLALRGTGDLRTDYAEPATAATVCAALQIPAADWAPVIRPAGEAAFGVVHPGGGLAASQAAWGGIWGYYRRAIAAKQASPDGGLVAQMYLTMKQAGYTVEEIVRAVATVSNGAAALLPVLERALLWLLQHPDAVAGVFLGERTWPQVIREAMVQGALFPVTPPLVAGQDARIGDRPVPEGTVVLPSLVSAVHHPRGGAWLTFGPGQHRCPGDELTLAAVEEYAGAFFRRYPGAHLTTPVLAWRDGPLATPREARFAIRGLPRAGTVAALPGASLLRPRPRRSVGLARAADRLPGQTACSTSPPYTSGSSGCSRSARRLNSAKPGSASCSLCAWWLGTSTAMTYLTTSCRLSVPNATREIRALRKEPRAL
jgi:cytochrome P450